MLDGVQPNMNLVPDDGRRRDDASGNQWWFWIILIFLFFLGFSRGGGLGGGNATTNTVSGLTNEALLFQLNSQLNNDFNRISDRLCDGFNGVQNTLCNVRGDIQGVNYNIATSTASITHQNDMNTCAITNAIHEDGNATRALINNLEAQRLRDRILALEGSLNNSQQTASIVNALRPYPAPAFIAPNPQAPLEPFGFGQKCFA